MITTADMTTPTPPDLRDAVVRWLREAQRFLAEPDEVVAIDGLIAVLAASPLVPASTCPTCGAPTLKPGERHAKVLPPRIRSPFSIAPDEDDVATPSEPPTGG